MRWLPLSAIVVAACGVDVDVHTVSYDDRYDTGEMDIHAPVGASATPAILLIHGGGWWYGDRDETDPIADRFARAGYVVANLDYRLVPDAIFPAQVFDSFCALAYLRAHADELGIDPARIGVAGFSAGAHLASMLAFAADVPELQDDACPSGRTGPAAALAGGAGPYKLDILLDDTTTDFLGVPYSQDPERWELASPITHVGAGEPPSLLFHAEHDLVIDIGQSERMRDTLRKAGNQSWFLRLEGGGHALNEGAGLGYEQYELLIDTPVAWAAQIDFFDSTLGAP
jgi:acetyl esterase/lipase